MHTVDQYRHKQESTGSSLPVGTHVHTDSSITHRLKTSHCESTADNTAREEVRRSGHLTWRSGSVRGNSSNTGGSDSGLLQRGDKHHTPPAHWPALHLSTGHAFYIVQQTGFDFASGSDAKLQNAKCAEGVKAKLSFNKCNIKSLPGFCHWARS